MKPQTRFSCFDTKPRLNTKLSNFQRLFLKRDDNDMQNKCCCYQNIYSKLFWEHFMNKSISKLQNQILHLLFINVNIMIFMQNELLSSIFSFVRLPFMRHQIDAFHCIIKGWAHNLSYFIFKNSDNNKIQYLLCYKNANCKMV